MKKLTQFAADNGLIVVPITYRAQGIKLRRKGFDLCKPNGEIIISLEPVTFICLNDKWFIRHNYSGYSGPLYLNRITTNYLNTLDISAKSYTHNSIVTN